MHDSVLAFEHFALMVQICGTQIFQIPDFLSLQEWAFFGKYGNCTFKLLGRSFLFSNNGSGDTSCWEIKRPSIKCPCMIYQDCMVKRRPAECMDLYSLEATCSYSRQLHCTQILGTSRLNFFVKKHQRPVRYLIKQEVIFLLEVPQLFSNINCIYSNV